MLILNTKEGDVENLFNGISFSRSTDEDYHRPIRTKSVFNGNYIELSSREYLDMIKPYLSDIIKDHKTPKNL